MPKLYPIQHSFANGMISEYVLSRSDLDIYKNSVYHLENFAPRVQGPVQRRPGAGHLTRLPGTEGRAFGFPVTRYLGFFVIITSENLMYVFDQGGPVSEVVNDVQNGRFLQLGANWTADAGTFASVNFSLGNCELIPSFLGGSHARIDQQITVSTPGALNYLDIRTDTTTSLGNLLVTLGTSQGASNLYSNTITTDLLQDSWDPQGNGTAWLRIEAPGGQTGVSRDISSVYSGPSEATPVEFVVPWEKSDLEYIQVDMPPSFDIMYFK